MNMPAVFTPDTLADRWACSAQHVRDMIGRGELRSFRAGKLLRIPASEVERIEEGREAQSRRGWERGLERVREAQAR